MSKKLLIISQYFYPEDFRVNDIANELSERGYDVKVVTAIPNYPEGKFYAGYGINKPKTEQYGKIEIIRLPIISRGSSAIQLALNYLSFIVSGYWFARTTKLRPDLIFTYEVSPMTQALIGPWLARRIKKKTMLYVLDLWPENLEVAANISNQFILKNVRRMVNFIYKNTDLILASSKSFVKEIQQYDISHEKVKYWPQYGEEIYYPIYKEKDKYRWNFSPDKFTIGFTGNIGYAQGLQILPKVARSLQDQGLDILFLLVGDGRAKDDLLQEIRKEAVETYFQFIDRQPSDQIADILAEVDVAFLSFDEDPIYRKTIPAKLQTYMACAKPLLISASGEVEQIVDESQAGLSCQAGEVDSLVDIIRQFMSLASAEISQMAENSRSYFEENFSKRKLIDQLEQYINKE